jgi:hypothetical protein
MHHHRTSVSKAAAKLVNAPLRNGKDAAKPKAGPKRSETWNAPPDKFTYALAAYTVERREKGGRTRSPSSKRVEVDDAG